MMWLIIIIVIAAAFYFMMRPRQQAAAPQEYDRSASPGMLGGAGSMISGMILGYLLSNYLISNDQYNEWQNMNTDQLQQTLVDNGIMNEAQFGFLADRAASGELGDMPADGAELGDREDYYAGNDDFDDFGGGDFDV